MTQDARQLSKMLDVIDTACWEIKENDQCSECPLKGLCLEETPLIEVADLMSASSWDEFLHFADTCIPSEELQHDMAMNQDYDNYRDRSIGL